MNATDIAEHLDGTTIFKRIVATWLDLIFMFFTLCFFDYLLGNQLYNTLLLPILTATILAPMLLEYFFGFSLGKLVLGLRVVSDESGRASFKACLINHLSRIIEVYIVSIVSLICACTNDHQKRLGNRFSTTVVIPKSKLQKLQTTQSG